MESSFVTCLKPVEMVATRRRINVFMVCLVLCDIPEERIKRKDMFYSSARVANVNC